MWIIENRRKAQKWKMSGKSMENVKVFRIKCFSLDFFSIRQQWKLYIEMFSKLHMTCTDSFFYQTQTNSPRYEDKFEHLSFIQFGFEKRHKRKLSKAWEKVKMFWGNILIENTNTPSICTLGEQCSSFEWKGPELY